MGTKLSHMLIDLGFFSALGTLERVGPGMGDWNVVKRGEPNTYGSNNGVTVVYDENGRPWIARAVELVSVRGELRNTLLEHNARHGVYVPHSNDGGYFVRETLPQL
jgi:hypothetical protein